MKNTNRDRIRSEADFEKLIIASVRRNIFQTHADAIARNGWSVSR